MSENEWNEIDDKALAAIILNFSNVLQQVLLEKTFTYLWVRLGEFYLNKCGLAARNIFCRNGNGNWIGNVNGWNGILWFKIYLVEHGNEWKNYFILLSG